MGLGGKIGSTMNAYPYDVTMNMPAFGNIILELHNIPKPSMHTCSDSLQIKQYASIQWHGFGVTEMTLGFASFSVNWRLCIPKVTQTLLGWDVVASNVIYASRTSIWQL